MNQDDQPTERYAVNNRLRPSDGPDAGIGGSLIQQCVLRQRR
jgi:hypothetical protein